MKKLAILVISGVTFFATSQEIEVKEGWNLIGSTEKISNMDSFTSDCVKSIWAYRDNSWSVYHTNKDTSITVNQLSSIDIARGFWINAVKNCTISTDTTTDVEHIEVDSDGLIITRGYDTVKESCTLCHSGKYISSSSGNRDWWRGKISLMKSYGLIDKLKSKQLEFNEAREQTILDYLETNYNTSNNKRVIRRVPLTQPQNWYKLNPSN